MMRVKVARPQVDEAELEAVGYVLLSGEYVSGRYVEQFEAGLAEYVGARYAVAVNSGTAALHAALVAMGVGPYDEVIVPALSFFATVSPVLHVGARPVFVDVLPDTYCIDPDGLKAVITPETQAIIPVHLFGGAADMDEINDIAQRYDLTIIEDCAQAHGTTYRGRRVGALGDVGGDIGIFSFYATKHMTTGEGGMLVTDSSNVNWRTRQFRSHGLDGRDQHVMLGLNYRMTEMEAAMGLVQLGKLDALNAARIRISETLTDALADIEWLRITRRPDHVGHTYFWLAAYVDEEILGYNTAALTGRLADKGIEVRHRYTAPLYRQPVLGDAYKDVYLPVAERVAGRLIGLPNRPDMTQAEIEYVVDILHKVGR